MDFLVFKFPVSQIETSILIPPLVAFSVSIFISMAGVSGAFLLLPFQVSFLNFTTLSVSATNFVYNIVAIPNGVYRYLREGRMAWPLTLVVVIGTLPDVFIGYYLRVLYMPDPHVFKLFVGCVLLCIGLRLLYEMTPRSQRGETEMKTLEEKFAQQMKKLKEKRSGNISAGIPTDAVPKTILVTLRRVEYEFRGERFSFNSIGMFMPGIFITYAAGCCLRQ